MTDLIGGKPPNFTEFRRIPNPPKTREIMAHPKLADDIKSCLDLVFLSPCKCNPGKHHKCSRCQAHTKLCEMLAYAPRLEEEAWRYRDLCK